MDNPQWLVVISSSTDKLPSAVLRWADNIQHLCLENLGRTFNIKRSVYSDGLPIEETTQSIPARARDLIEAVILMSLRKTVDNGFVLYKHDANIFDLVRAVLLSARIPYGIWFENDVTMSWVNQHMLANARLRLCFDEDTKTAFRRQHVFDCEYYSPEDVLPNFDLVASRTHQHSDFYENENEGSEENRKILLISYYMPPAETVAVHRLNYWEEMLPKIAMEQDRKVVNVTALTAMHSYQSDGQYLFVPDDGGYACRDGKTVDLVNRLKSARVNFFAAYWTDLIIQFFENNKHLKYDSIVLSGNPFFYFDLGEYFKNNWDATVVLDFRDPFANNPRFKYTDAHKSLAVELETRYIANADYAISVNKYCVDSLIVDDPQKTRVVANGYDERVVDTIPAIPVRENAGLINFVYTGSFYADRDPEPFLKALNPKQHSLVHIGRSRETDAHLDQYEGMKRYGLMPYEDVIGYCKSMDVGIIFTSGAAFEQTTKIFDYIATGLNIVIVTEGEPFTGELHNLTKDLQGVHWVKNKEKDIRGFLSDFKLQSKSKTGERRFSRYAQTETLYELIK